MRDSDRRNFLRRIVTLTASAGVAGLLLDRLPGKSVIQPVQASNPPMLIDTPNTGSSTTSLSSSASPALTATNTGSGAALQGSCTAGTGVMGVAGGTSTGTGVQGVASGSGGTALAGFAGDPGAIPIVAQGASGQTANLQEWRNGSGKVSAVSANGAIIAPQVGQQIPNINYGNAGTSNPAGTISKNMVMCGIKFLFTPKVSGNIIGFFHGDIASTMVGGRPRAQINYGAGTPPNNGDAVTGNIITTLEDAIGYGSNQVMPVTFPFTVSATNNGGPLVVGTQYWFDAAQAAAVGGTATLTNVYFVILEI